MYYLKNLFGINRVSIYDLQKIFIFWNYSYNCNSFKSYSSEIFDHNKFQKYSNSRQQILDWVKTKEHSSIIAPTAPEWKYLIQATGLRKSTISKILKYYSEIPGKVTNESKKIIQEWLNEIELIGRSFESPISNKDKLNDINDLPNVQTIQSNHGEEKKIFKLNHLIITESELLQVTKKSDLNKNQVLRIARYLLDKKSEFTDEKKAIIESWINENKRKPSVIELNRIRLKTQLSKNQILNFIQYRLFPQVKLSETSLSEIKIIIQSFEGKIPETAKNDLKKMYGLGSKQLSDLIRKFKKTHISPISRKMILEYSQGKTSLSKQDIENLQQITNLNPLQISLIFKSISEKTEMTPHKKYLLQKWFEENNFKKPNNNELNFLKNSFILQKDQILYQRRILIEKRLKS